MNDKVIGVRNESADKVPRTNKTWSDTNLDYKFDTRASFSKLECTCGEVVFEVLHVDLEWETLARCNACGKYYIVHAG